MVSCRSALFCVLSLLLLATPLHLAASTVQFQVLLDTDNHGSTGCSTVIGGTTIAGVEQILTTTVEVTSSGSNVTGVTRQACAGSSFGAPIIVDSTGWPVSTGGENGFSHVETHIPLSAFGGSLPAVQRLYIAGTAGSFTTLLMTDEDNRSILYPRPHGRRHSVSPDGELHGRRTIILDGQVGDWNGVQPLVENDDSQGNTAIQFGQIFAFAGANDLFFRIDVQFHLTAPIAVDDTYQGRQGRSLNVAAPGVLGNDSSPTGNPLHAILVSQPQHGTVTLFADGSFAYMNNGASASVDQFKYKANDGSADSNTATVTINITPNSAPIANNDTYNVPHGGTINVPAPGVLGNDSDPDGDHITAVLQNGPQHGTLTLNPNGSFTYTHNGSNSNSDSFRYRATDGVLSTLAIVTITIGPDAPPVAVGDAYTVAEGGTLNVPAPGLFANDSDPDSPQALWTATVGTAPAHGTLTLGANGAFIYVHDGSETTSDSFTYVLNDGIVSAPPATVTITVTPVNDLPVANADAYSTNEDTPLNVIPPGVLGNDTDVDLPPQTLTAVLVSGPTHGTLTLNPSGSFTYTPNANYNGPDSFTYNANDGVANSAAPATVSITVNAVNDAPVFTSGGNVTVNEDSGPHSQAWATGVGPGGGADEAGQTLTFNITANSNSALFSAQPAISPAGVLTFTPAANANGSANITVFLQDNGGTANGGVDSSAPVTFTITVNAVNDAPTFTLAGNPAASNEDAGPQTVLNFATGMSAGPADEAGQTLTFNVTGNTNSALFSGQPAIDATTGTLTYTAAPDAFGTATITVVLMDNGGTANGGVDTSAPQTFTITVNPVNDAPSFTSGGNVTGLEDTPFSQAWATAISAGPANEAGQTLTFNVTANTNGGLFSVQPAISPAGVLSFTPAPNANGTATITVNLMDNGGTANGGVDTSTPVTFTITVTAVNDAPSFTLAGNPAASNEDAGPQTVPNFATGMSAGPADEAGQTLAFNVTGNTNPGLFGTAPSIDPTTGTLTYTAAADAFGTATITVVLMDNGGTANGGVDTSAPQSFTITVNPVNDAPSFTGGGNVTGLEDTPFSQAWATAISAGPANESGQTLTFNVTGNTNPSLFSAGPSISPSGVLSFTSALNANGSASITVVLQDNGGTANGGVDTSAPVTFTITITAVNDAPSFAIAGDPPPSNEDAGPQTVPGFATAISAGPADEAGQTLTFNVTGNTNPGLFSSGPAIDATTGALTYTATANIGGTALITVVLQDNGGTANGGVDTSAPQTFTITVNAVNDPPSITAPATATITEDTPFAFNGPNTISISDPDAGSGNIRVDLNALHGVLNFSTAGLVSTGSVPSGGTFMVGTLANVNTALATLTYTPTGDYNGPDLFRIDVTDNGNTGSGGPLTDTKTVNITITGVNDPPVNVINSTGVTDEDTALNLSTVNNGVNVTDVDAGSADIQVVFTATSGTLFMSSTSGITTVTGNGTSTLTLVGPQGAIDNDLLTANGGLVYTPNLNFNGTDTVTMVSNDLGNSGAGGPLSDTDSMTITVNAVNDAPVNIMPSSPTMDQDSTFVLSGMGAIQTSDVDSTTAAVTLTATNGTMTLSGTTGLAFTTGDGTADATMAFSGLITDINNALNGLAFTSSPGFFGTASINIVTDDQGNTGAGGPLQDNDTLNITVIQVNQAPVNVVPGTQTTNEDTVLTFSTGTGNAISTSDTDAGAASVTITLGVLNGNLHLVPTAGVAITNNDTANVTASGSIANLNTALDGLTYTPNLNFNGTDTLTFTTNDNGNTGPGGPKSDTDTVTITITAVDDAPVITRPAAVTTAEDVAFTFNGANAISVGDVDAGSGSLTVTLSVTNGTLNLSGTTGLAPLTGNGTNSISATGTLTNLNNALNGMTYTGTLDFNGSDTLNIGVTDNGNTGTGGPLTDSKSTSITVTAVNDKPVNTVPGTQTFNEDTTLTFSNGNGNAISVADVDAGSGNVTVTLVTTAGTMTFGTTAGLSAVTNNAATITGTGTLTNINNALQNLVFTPTLNLNGAQTITLTTSDNGNTGSGGAQSDVDVINLSITAVNDAPTITRPPTISVNEDTQFTFTGGNAITVADVDAASGTVNLTIGAANGTITLTTGGGATINTNGTSSVTASGTITQLNAALTNAKYQGVLNFYGTDTISINVNDNGNTGSGGALQANASITVTVNPVNDPPVAISYCASGCTNGVLPAQAGIPITFPAGKLGGNDEAHEVTDGSVVSIVTTPDTTCAGCAVTINANGSFTFTPPPAAAGTNVTFTYHVSDTGFPAPGVNSAPATVTFNVAGPAIYFVKSAAVGTGACTLGNECLFATAVTTIGASANAIIFMEDANSHAPGAVTLNSGGMVIGQGVTGGSFDAFFGIGIPSSGTLAARPSINQTRPTLTNSPLTLNTNSQARGFNISTNAGSGLTAVTKTGLVVSDMDISTSAGGGTFGATFTSTSTGTFSFGNVTATGAAGGLNFNATTSASTVTANNISTGSGPALTAVSTGATNFTLNDVTSTTGTAVTVTTATGAFTFHAINAGTSGSGPTKGVTINALTGAGTFTVNGTGTTAGTGGTIQKTTSHGVELVNAANVTLKNMNLTNDAQSQSNTNLACGNNMVLGDTTLCTANLFINGSTNLVLNNLSISGSTQEGIAGTNVNGLTLTNCTIFGNGNEDYENGLLFENLIGTVSITGTTVRDNFSRQSYVENGSGTLDLTVSGSSFTRTSAPTVSSQQAFLIEGHNTAQMNMSFSATTFSQSGNGNGLQVLAIDSARVGSSGTHSVVSNCTFTNNAAHVFAETGGGGVVFFDTTNNTAMTVAGLQSIDYFVSTGATASSNLTGIISGNVIGTAASQSACNGANGCDGITVDKDGAGSMNVRISGNTVQNFNTNGIKVRSNLTGNSALQVLNNTVQLPSGGALQGNALLSQVGPQSGSTTTMCLNATGNTFTGTYDPNGSTAAILTSVKNNTITNLPGLVPASGASNAQVATFLSGNNGGASALAQNASGGTYVGGAACSTP